MPTPEGIISCRRGANIAEYVILIGAVALVALGMLRLFGSQVQEKISGQSAQVTSLEGKRAGGEGSGKSGDGSGQGDIAQGSGKSGAGQPAGDKLAASGNTDVAGNGEGSGKMAPGGEVAAGAQAKGAMPAAGGSVVTISSEPAEDTMSAPRFNFGWVLTGVGTVIFLFVLFKGMKDKRQMQAEAAADKR